MICEGTSPPKNFVIFDAPGFPRGGDLGCNAKAGLSLGP